MSEINASTPVDFGQPAQQYAAPFAPIGAVPIAAAPKKSRKGVYLVSALLVVGGLVGLSATHSSASKDSSTGSLTTTKGDVLPGNDFHNIATLEAGVKVETQKQVVRMGLSDVDTVLCIKQSGTEYVCNITLVDATANTVNVTVAADGQSWVSR